MAKKLELTFDKENNILVKWVEELFNEAGEIAAHGLPHRRVFYPTDYYSRKALEELTEEWGGDHIRKIASVAWADISYPEIPEDLK